MNQTINLHLDISQTLKMFEEAERIWKEHTPGQTYLNYHYNQTSERMQARSISSEMTRKDKQLFQKGK